MQKKPQRNHDSVVISELTKTLYNEIPLCYGGAKMNAQHNYDSGVSYPTESWFCGKDNLRIKKRVNPLVGANSKWNGANNNSQMKSKNIKGPKVPLSISM